ncbi:peptidase inhibitor family I36 protein [Nocardiopsis dassonvillei]
MDAYLDDFGGTQVSANRIELEGGEIVVAAPGEKYAHDLAVSGDASAAAACPYGYFCMYTGTYYTGNQYSLLGCGTYGLHNWIGNGSYINNQPPGTVVTIPGAPGSDPTRSVAYDADPVYDWTFVRRITLC